MPYYPPASGQTTTVTNTVKVEKKVNAQTGTSYTLVGDDASSLITFSNLAPTILTVPTNAKVSFPIGTVIELIQLGAGQLTVDGGAVTIMSKGDQKSLKAQYSQATLIKTEVDTWVLTGELLDPAELIQ